MKSKALMLVCLGGLMIYGIVASLTSTAQSSDSTRAGCPPTESCNWASCQ